MFINIEIQKNDMKILSFDEYVSEKMKIIPLTDDEFQKINDNPVDEKNDDYKNRTLCSLGIFGNDLKNSIMMKAIYDFHLPIEKNWKKLSDAEKDTEERFDSWENLDSSEIFKKNKQRSEKKMTPEKVIATMYCAFKRYRLNRYAYDNIGDKIIRCYMDRLNREFGLSDKDIIKIYFE